ncbi:MAG: nitrite reductase small subunit NirD [Burkholderiales bacterium]
MTDAPELRAWRRACLVGDIPRLGARRVRSRRGDIAVFRNEADEIFALADRCPHKGGPLSQGIVFGRNVSCPLHGWVIGLNHGCAAEPDEGCVETFQVKIKSGEVWLYV